MASLAKEGGGNWRIHWKFRVRVGRRTGELIEGSVQLGRCTKAAAKGRLREIETWEEAVKTGRHVPDTFWVEVRDTWLRERDLMYTEQTLARARRVFSMYERWRKERNLPSKTIEQVANRQDLTAWRDHRLDQQAGRKTVANDFSTLAELFRWCVREKYLPDNPMDRIARPRFITKKEGTPLTRAQPGGFELSGTIGQADAGPIGMPMTGGDFELTGGFWFRLDEGDCNSDGGVNLFDFEEFESCITGPGGDATNECAYDDLDGDIDLIDFSLFQSAFNG